jgi:glycosyltransferase involved in cell wall biosynthesis
MNVLMITGIFPPDIGGPATYVPLISSELAKRGHKITVVTLSERPGHADGSYDFVVRRIRRGLPKPLRLLFTVARILREGQSAHVLYVNGLFIEAVIANLILRKPMVQKIVGDWAWERATNERWVLDGFDEFQKRKYDFRVGFLKALRSFCARRADNVIVPSQYLANALRSWGVPDAGTTVIYNAVELPALKRSIIPLSTRFKVVTVGRLVPWKQIDRLIESLSECDQAGLLIIGDGPERTRLEALAREKKVADRVCFAGQKNKDETFALMAGCDLFVLNSSYEGFPHVVLEAMSAGLPVVATMAGGTPELVRHGENGVLIAPNANGALSRTLIRLLTSREERRRLAAGARETTQRFRRSAMIEATEAALRAAARS